MAVIKIDKKAFFHNIEIIGKKADGLDKVALVLKDNAYGHGLELMASLAQEAGLKKAVVRTQDEAKLIESYFEYILVLADIPERVENKMTYTINDLESISQFPCGCRVELKVDSGMHRNGIDITELKEAFDLIARYELKLEAVFTHHRNADALSSEWFWQNENFKEIKSQASALGKEYGFSDLRFHSANSASLFRHSSFDEDMVRVGIAAYGCLEMDSSFGEIDLRPALSLYADKISTRILKKDTALGYGGIHSALEDSKVSNYDFGYADGFLRHCSNNYLTPNSVKLLGRISMDNSSFESEEKTLLIFDDAQQIARSAQTIAYEVLVSLSRDIVREVI